MNQIWHYCDCWSKTEYPFTSQQSTLEHAKDCHCENLPLRFQCRSYRPFASGFPNMSFSMVRNATGTYKFSFHSMVIPSATRTSTQSNTPYVKRSLEHTLKPLYNLDTPVTIMRSILHRDILKNSSPNLTYTLISQKKQWANLGVPGRVHVKRGKNVVCISFASHCGIQVTTIVAGGADTDNARYASACVNLFM